MSQQSGKIFPRYLNTDEAYEKLLPNESPFIKGLSSQLIDNPEKGDGTNNTIEQGQSADVLTKTKSNAPYPNIELPRGFNKNCGKFESTTTQELYWFNFNGDGNHGIYVINGNTGQVNTLIIDPKLNFSDLPEHYISEHRVTLRVVYDENKNILEKYLVWTNGNNWQGWINVIAAIQTNGFDTQLYPYWSLQPPHFDRNELFEYAVRPPMVAPIANRLANTDEQKGQYNEMLDKAFRYCIEYVYTDGRITTVSPFSLPYITKTTDFLANPDILPKRCELTLYAGSCMVEKINVYVQKSATQKDQYNSDLQSWTDWYLYDTINKFTSCEENSPLLIGDKYWLRRNQWQFNDYDSVYNTIKYVFDNSKLWQIADQNKFSRIQNDMPILSVGMSDLGDNILLCNNKYNYDNFTCEVTDKISISVKQKENEVCPNELRTIYAYIYVGRDRLNMSPAYVTDELRGRSAGYWVSQIPYYDGDDTTIRFGGQYINQDGVSFKPEESKYFDLTLTDKKGFRAYLKGTEYYSDCEWFVVNGDTFDLIPVSGEIDIQNESDKTFINGVYNGLNFFVGRFKFIVPAGRYNMAIGRHNVANNQDYRSASTYVMGIANSRNTITRNLVQFLFPIRGEITRLRVVPGNNLVSYSKEMEIDCTNGDVDTWGNGQDLFYVYTPFNGSGTDSSSSFFADTKDNWSFIEGYLKEDRDNPLSVELFPYRLSPSQASYNGQLTDKNGFFWGYTWGDKENENRNSNVLFTAKLNCNYPSEFEVENGNDGVYSWKRLGVSYLSNFNGGQVGNGNRILYRGRITDLSGLIGYSNIGISIKDGGTVYTNNNGEFTLIIHNGMNTLRVSNVYVNASGQFRINLADCGEIPLTQFNEANSVCTIDAPRIYPTELRLSVRVSTGEQNTIKSNASYIVGIAGFDLAGRCTFVNKITEIKSPSYNQIDKVVGQYIQANISGNLNLPADIKWASFFITKPINYKKYIQWVGDKIDFLDSNGLSTTDIQSPSLVRITIDSLLKTNINQNFTLLSSYQFVNGDRLRILDNGEGDLFDTNTFGDVIDVDILGTNYNQSAINANLLLPPANTVLPNNQIAGENPVTLFATYDSRFDKLFDKTGFWIELYTPSENSERLPFFEIVKTFPVINGNLAEYQGGGISLPSYTYPVNITLEYWDTYLINRSISIPSEGNKYINHAFESPNITDKWGANIISGGRQNTVNPNAMQLWYLRDTIRSDNFLNEGRLNGLGSFRSANRKNFIGYKRGGIVGVINQYSNILFICEQDWFVVDYNVIFTRALGDSIVTVNLDNQMGEPHIKIGGNYGALYTDTDTIGFYDNVVWWLDSNNESFILCDYASANDVADIIDDKGRKYGIKSWLKEKLSFTNQWNILHDNKDRFERHCGIDIYRNNLILTFRPNRNNSNNELSYINNRRNWDIKTGETVLFNLNERRWIKAEGYVPESYGKLRGVISGVELISFAGGKPYIHTQTGRNNIITKAINCCPDGFTQQGDTCVQTITTPATQNSDEPFVAISKQDIKYNELGTSIYSNYESNGTGDFELIPSSNPFWINNMDSLTAGALNRCGFWNSLGNEPLNTWVGASFEINIPQTGYYYVGLSADNIARLTVDCDVVIEMDAEAMAENHDSNFQICWKMFHIYPVLFTQGRHIIKLEGKNFIAGGAFGAEIYNNTKQEIINATSYNDLNLIYSTSQLFGQQVQEFNYSCPEGGCQSVIFENGSYVCKSIQTVVTNCKDTKVIDGAIGNSDFLNFYGVQTEHILIGSFNENEKMVKILQSVGVDSIPNNMFIDMIFDSLPYSFSFLPLNLFFEKEKIFYGAIRRDMSSYLQDIESRKWLSTFQDGKRIVGEYMIVRFVGDYNTLKEYFELVDGVSYLYTSSAPTKT